MEQKVKLEDGHIYVNSTEIENISYINIKKEASNLTEVTIKFNATVDGIDFNQENYQPTRGKYEH